MSRATTDGRKPVARRLLGALVAQGAVADPPKDVADALVADDLAARDAAGRLVPTAAGRARWARDHHPRPDGVGAHRAQHMAMATRDIGVGEETIRAVVNDGESPLAWLARRKGRAGRALIDAHQFAAGERLRADFTLAHLTPRVTSSWDVPTARGGGGYRGGEISDRVIAARQRLRRALDEAGPEFAGLLMDVCCFLHGLEDAERARGWPARSAKVVLQLGLDRLARHYGLRGAIRGAPNAKMTTWLAEGAAFPVE
jgi:hypothetical protein